MLTRRAAIVVGALSLTGAACGRFFHRSTLPAALDDREFWRLSAELSEPAGSFPHSENLVSNELHFAQSVRLLRAGNGVYVGVGPEQNFSYIAKLRPPMAFVVDIRQQNRNLHLLYKALFEASVDRADFVSRLFSRERPAGLDRDASVQDLFAALRRARPAPGLYEINKILIRERLAGDHGFPLTPDDLNGLDYVLHAFLVAGPDITYGPPSSENSPRPSYGALMTATDMTGEARSYLASEDAFAAVKALQLRNLVVPVVGDFAGPRTIRGIGQYVREHGSTVSAFYGSNVEVYLNQQQMAAHCANLATLPHTSSTWFIGSKGMRPLPAKLNSCLGPAH
jgi:hypothetical protein